MSVESHADSCDGKRSCRGGLDANHTWTAGVLCAPVDCPFAFELLLLYNSSISRGALGMFCCGDHAWAGSWQVERPLINIS